jgi:hypothetical protein
MTLVGAMVGALPAPAMAGAGPDRSCDGPPVRMRLESRDPAAGGSRFRVTDGVARRVPILTGRDGPATTRKETEELRDEAAETKLALYQVHLADFRIPRRLLTGELASAFATPTPEPGQLVGTLSIVPTKRRGLRAGDVVDVDDEIRFDTVTTFATVGLGITTADGETGSGTPSGEVEIVAVDDDEICVDVDFQLVDDGQVVAAAQGTVSVPVVRSANPDLYFF